MMGGEVMEIVDRLTGRISPYPAHSNEFHSMKVQIDRQRYYHPDYRFFYRLRYQVDPNSAVATENVYVMQSLASVARGGR